MAATASTPGSAAGDPPAPPSSTNKPLYTANATTTRRNANGSVSSVYSGNKIRHLKKEDGVPLWRKDIQYDFLKYVFEDEKRVFHKASDGTYGHTFADIYLDAMAKSSKCSKILKDKLLTERPAALNMAMVCLLVNVGRMNTTLNCMAAMSRFVEERILQAKNITQSFPKCELSCGRTTRSLRYRHARTRTRISSYRTPQG
jgi:Ino eighty subunit 1